MSLFLTFLSAALMLAQDRQPATLRVNVSLVTVGVRVTDARGNAVTGLQAHDFSLYEEGAAQEIAFFANVEQPLSLGILLDRSDSMQYAEKLERAKAAAQALVDATQGDSEFLYISFDGNFDRRPDFSADREGTAISIAGTTVGGGTSLYDSIIWAVERCRRARHGRQALVIITDGADQHSTHTLDEMIAAAQESQAQLFTIGYFSAAEADTFRTSGRKVILYNYLLIDNPMRVFKRLADQTGAAAFFPRSDTELQQVVGNIINDLRTQYTLAYYPSNTSPDPRYRNIKVKVRQPGLKVRARPGYLRRADNP